ncbi:MAG: AbrB family transcriptional regulator [Erysipelotrichaceae bacterium]|nr:AbrB family transcriptional regulator [Erysipelotrichaceae bacterium]
MTNALLLVLTLICGYLGSILLEKLRMPVPFMLGSMFAVAALNIFSGMTWLPSYAKALAQSVSGCFIGLSLSRKDIRGIRQLIVPTSILIGFLLVFTAVMGMLLSKVFGIDKATAFLVSIPGGVTEVSLMASDFGAVPATVSFIQTFRLFTVYMVFPAMIGFFSKSVSRDEEVEALEEFEEETREHFLDRFIPDNYALRQIITVTIAIIGGFLGKASGLPAGTLSFAMIFTILFNFNTSHAVLEKKYKRYAQLLSGALIGRTMTMEMVMIIPQLILPTAILMIGYVLTNLLLSWLMKKTGKIDFNSAMFASSPGGASDMALIASELGGESPKIAIMHIVRLLACYTIFPLWTKLLLSIFG